MLIFNSSGRAIWLALAGAATLLAGTVSRAEICSAEKFYNGTTYRYSICHVTDLDQRREELPPFTVGLPNGGKMYLCAYVSYELDDIYSQPWISRHHAGAWILGSGITSQPAAV